MPTHPSESNLSLYALDEPTTRTLRSSILRAVPNQTEQHALSVSTLSPLQLGVLCLLFDLKSLPTPYNLRATHPSHTLARALESLEPSPWLVVHDHPPHTPFLCLSTRAHEILHTALRTFFNEHIRSIRATLEYIQPPLISDTPHTPLRVWLRSIAATIAGRGMRFNTSGQLHGLDLKALERVSSPPTSNTLSTSAALGSALGVFLRLPERLIIGDQIDLLDLPDEEFLFEVFNRWIRGDFTLRNTSLFAIYGLFPKWLRLWSTPPTSSSIQHPTSTHTVAPDRLPFFNTYPSIDRLSAADQTHWRIQLDRTHTALRSAFATSLTHLPRGVPLPTHTLQHLWNAQRTLNLLNPDGQATLPKSLPTGQPPLPNPHLIACTLLPSVQHTLHDTFTAFLNALSPSLSLSLQTNELETTLTIPPTLPTQNLTTDASKELSTPDVCTTLFRPNAHNLHSSPQPSSKRATVLANGEVIVPPEASVHILTHIAQGSEATRLETVSTFQINARSLLRVDDAGMSLTSWSDALKEMIQGALPATVEVMIQDAIRKQGEFTIIPAGALLIARDPIRLDEALSQKGFAHLLLLRPTPELAVLKYDISLEPLLRQLADQGFSAHLLDRLPKTYPQSND